MALVPVVWYDGEDHKAAMSVKSGSSTLGQLLSMKSLWQAGRGLLDSVAGALGVPLAGLRSSWASRGFDADRFETEFAAQLAAQGITQANAERMTADQANSATLAAAEKSKQPPQLLVIIGVLGGLILLPKVFGGVLR